MPALEPSPGTARVAISGVANGVPVVNVFHCYRQSLPTASYTAVEIGDVASKFASEFSARFAVLLNTSWQGGQCVAQDLTSDIGFSGSAAVSATGIGTGNIPQNAAACISWKIGRHYRGGHPRTYIGPLASGAISTPTSLDSSFITTLSTAANNFRLNLASNAGPAGALTLICLHRIRGGNVLSPPLRDAIVGSSVDTRIDSMRRRLGPDR